MSCPTCDNPPRTGPARARHASPASVAGVDARTALAMCHLCLHGSDEADGSCTRCELAGTPVELMIGLCPIRRHPRGETQLVRWCLVNWRGVPAPLRWWLPADVRAKLEGCGCIDRLKRIVDAAARGCNGFVMCIDLATRIPRKVT